MAVGEYWVQKPESFAGPEFGGTMKMRDFSMDTDKDSQYYGWIFIRHHDGQWVTVRRASSADLGRYKRMETLALREKPAEFRIERLIKRGWFIKLEMDNAGYEIWAKKDGFKDIYSGSNPYHELLTLKEALAWIEEFTNKAIPERYESPEEVADASR